MRLHPVDNCNEDEVRLHAGYLHIKAHDITDTKHLRTLLDAWYRTRATVVLKEQFIICLALVHGLHDLPNPPENAIRRMTRRWGSCIPGTARILLHPDLIRAPRPCIDYVIIHELCHLRHPDHSQAFYNLLSAIMPDCRERKMRLERSLA